MSWPIPERRAKLLTLYYAGLTYRAIAAEYGGTDQGVRSTIRKMRERGEAVAR
jgi:transposase